MNVQINNIFYDSSKEPIMLIFDYVIRKKFIDNFDNVPQEIIVKVGNKKYNVKDNNIKIFLSDSDKNNIRKMKKEYTKYCSYPNNNDSYDLEIIKSFMESKIEPKEV